MRLPQRCVKYFSIDFIHYPVAANPSNKRGRLSRGHWARGDCSAAGSQEVQAEAVAEDAGLDHYGRGGVAAVATVLASILAISRRARDIVAMGSLWMLP